MSEEKIYREWIERRRNVDAPSEFSDRVMQSIEELKLSTEEDRRSSPLLHAINESWLGQTAICLAALAVGMIPFVFTAYLAKFIAY